MHVPPASAPTWASLSTWSGLLIVALLLGCETRTANTPGATQTEQRPEAWEAVFETYRDPATDRIPRRVRAGELAYVRKLAEAHPAAKSGDASLFTWASAGPSNRGGRTRALAVDVTDPETILAGSVSGGLWKSTDGGANWALKTKPGDHLSVTALAQDPRPGHTNTWYYAGGEYRGGTSANDRGQRAPYMGIGVFKSTDNGETWTLLPGTADTDPTLWDASFDYVHQLVVSPTTGSVFIANNASGIYRSTDGGDSFHLVLGGVAQHAWNAVAVGSNGTIVATLSSLAINSGVTQAFSPGVYISTNDGGEDWTKMSVPSFPSTHQRSVISIAPSNPNIAYVLTYTGTIFSDGREDFRFHKLNLATGATENRSANLPYFPSFDITQGEAVHTFGNFCLTMAVKPDDENFVIIGGTTLYRSRDGFATSANALDVDETRIGGYDGAGGVFGNHYVDQHVVAFHPDRPNEAWTGNDGGVWVTRDVTAASVTWETQNNGYVVAKFYGIDIPATAGDHRVLGGAQDDGFLLVDAAPGTATIPEADKVMIGDGAYAHFAEQYVYVTRNAGEVYRLSYTSDGSLGSETYIGRSTFLNNPRFITPLAVDPSDEKVVYYPYNSVIYRNIDIEAPISSLTVNWRPVSATTVPAGYTISTLATSTANPSHVLYFAGTSFTDVPKLYRMADANTASDGVEDISIPNLPGGAYIHSIAVNPHDGNEILVALSNYNVTGLYHSTDGGQTFAAVEGNLEGDAELPGPSLRSATILPLAELGDNRTVYLIGTSAGLFSTTALDGAGTVWTQEAQALTGSAVVEYVTSRPSDGRVAIGTQGRGLFVGDPNPLLVANEAAEAVPEGFALAQNYPNPFNPTTQIPFTLRQPSRVTLTVFDLQGREVQTLLAGATLGAGQHAVPFDATGLASGTYMYRMMVQSDAGQRFTASRTMTLLR